MGQFGPNPSKFHQGAPRPRRYRMYPKEQPEARGVRRTVLRTAADEGSLHQRPRERLNEPSRFSFFLLTVGGATQMAKKNINTGQGKEPAMITCICGLTIQLYDCLISVFCWHL